MAECVRLVHAVLADPQWRAELAERARANARRFTWERTARIIFDASNAHDDTAADDNAVHDSAVDDEVDT